MAPQPSAPAAASAVVEAVEAAVDRHALLASNAAGDRPAGGEVDGGDRWRALLALGPAGHVAGRRDAPVEMGQNGTKWDKMESTAKRSRRAWRGLHACSWRPSPRSGRRGQRRAAHQWVAIEDSVRKSICVLSWPSRRRQGRTRSTEARRPCTATTYVTRICVSTIKACSASIELSADLVPRTGKRRSVSASIYSSAPMA